MSMTAPNLRTRRWTRATTTALAATAMAAGSILLAAIPAAAATPVLATCAFTDPNHVSLSLTGGLDPTATLGTVTLADSSDPSNILGTYNVTLLNGLIDFTPPSDLLLPGNSTGIDFSIQPITAAGTLLTPVIGNTPCAALPAVAGSYEVVTPARILDTRISFGGPRIAAKGTLVLTVAGRGGIPVTTGLVGLLGSAPEAVNINLTATNAGDLGYLTVYPTGQARPAVSNLNLSPGRNIANTAIAQLGTNGQISIYNNSTSAVDLVGDVYGYYNTGVLTSPPIPLLPGAYQPLTPSRLLDTRSLGAAGKILAQTTRSLTVTARGGVPATGVGSVVLNVTATNPTGKGHLRTFPSLTPVPFASNVNFDPGKTVANVVVVAPGTDGKVSIRNGSSLASVDVIVDVVGYIAGGLVPAQTAGLQNAVTPFRLLDTRFAIGIPTTTKVPANSFVTVKVAGRDGVPLTNARAAVVTVTATAENSVGFATVYPGPTRPTASILNFVTNTDVANLAITPIGSDGNIRVYNGSAAPAHLVIDISAYITGSTLTVG